MQRISEPELMVGESALEYSRGAFDHSHSRFMEIFRQHFPDVRGAATLLDIGCGHGDILKRFAIQYPDLNLYGLDGSADMLDLAREFIGDEHMAQVTLLNGVVPSVEMPLREFDILVSNSVLHHLSDPLDLWRTIHRCSHADTRVYVVDLLRPRTREDAERLVETYAGGDSPILRADFLNSLLASYEVAEIEEQLEAVGFWNVTVEQIDECHWAAVTSTPDR